MELAKDFPELAEAIRQWAIETQTMLPPTQQGWVNTFVARDQATQYNAPGGRINITSLPDTRSGS